MRRASALATVTALATAGCGSSSATTMAARPIYTTWGSIPCEADMCKESWLKRITSQSNYRSFEFWHVPEAQYPADLHLTPAEMYLLSCIENDADRLLHLSWGYDFDPFWHDRVNSLDMLYRILYKNEYPIYKYIFGNCASKTKEMHYIEHRLNYLKSVLHWASATERRFTALFKARYYTQRKVWNALERERFLCGCVEVVDSFRDKVPEEFREKAMGELEVYLVNMRHWVFDCPNGKRTFTRRLA